VTEGRLKKSTTSKKTLEENPKWIHIYNAAKHRSQTGSRFGCEGRGTRTRPQNHKKSSKKNTLEAKINPHYSSKDATDATAH